MTAGLIPAEELRKLQIRMNKLMEELGLDALGSKYIDELERMQKRIADLMEEVEGPSLNKGVIRPLADVHETDEAVVVTMDMPGVEKQDIDISVVDDELRSLFAKLLLEKIKLFDKLCKFGLEKGWLETPPQMTCLN